MPRIASSVRACRRSGALAIPSTGSPGLEAVRKIRQESKGGRAQDRRQRSVAARAGPARWRGRRAVGRVGAHGQALPRRTFIGSESPRRADAFVEEAADAHARGPTQDQRPRDRPSPSSSTAASRANATSRPTNRALV